MWIQKNLTLPPHPRGFHLITDHILQALPELSAVKVGLMNVFIKHSSASLTLNEDVERSVRTDMESYFSQIAPENVGVYEHMNEGPDDMPAHLKTSLLGCHLNIPICQGKPDLGRWQGIYLCEHRNHANERHLTLTVHGE